MQQLNEIHEDEDDGTHVPIRLVQFGCLDYDESTFSIEWEERFNERDAYVLFDGERREMCVKMRHGDAPGRLSLVAMRFSHIKSLSAPPSRRSQDSTLTIVLSVPPSFESETKNRFLRPDVKRTRLQHLPFGDHKRVVAFTSFALRLELPSQTALRDFCKLAKEAGLWHHVDEYDCPAVRNDVYAQHVLNKVRAWMARAPWCIAFQLASLLCSLLIRPGDLLSLEPQVREMQERFGEQYCARFLRYFQERLVAWIRYEDDAETVRECFDRAARDFERGGIQEAVLPTNASLFQSLHAIVTPTRIILQGPYPERSNRVIRMFDAQHHDSFLRVSFTEETKLQYRFDREVDTASFVRSRVGNVLKNGLVIAGREFEFLAYSQSALKEHTVYFVKPFRVGDTEVNAASIIASIGNFENSSDRFCPARYAARLSQAFTATDASIVVKPAETRKIADISTPDGMYHFTDGVGTMSREMAVDAYTEVRRYRKRATSGKGTPAAFQIRFMGSKGMLSVDYTLQGRVVCLRDSMIKFDCPNNRNLEIARVFDRPAKYYLNRPLIMLLEGLGVPYETFFQHQNAAVQDAYSSTESLTKAARMLEALGLGTSFRLPSVLLNLVKLCDIENIVDNKFYSRMLEFAIHHVLRELKNHARIPIPGAYTLVGVADVHGYLKEWEIFVCIKPHDSDEVTFLEGDILISRSPSIHPGDVQIARAIGCPRPGSPFAKEPLANTVVFSVRGMLIKLPYIYCR
ncbi:RNA dependent RNA polymerase-domain-containing protein [Schizophyllum commune]